MEDLQTAVIIFQDAELRGATTAKDFLAVQTEGTRRVQRILEETGTGQP